MSKIKVYLVTFCTLLILTIIFYFFPLFQYESFLSILKLAILSFGIIILMVLIKARFNKIIIHTESVIPELNIALKMWIYLFVGLLLYALLKMGMLYGLPFIILGCALTTCFIIYLLIDFIVYKQKILILPLIVTSFILFIYVKELISYFR